MTEQKGSLVRQLYMPAVLCTALWGSAAPCIKAGYGLFGIEPVSRFPSLCLPAGGLRWRACWSCWLQSAKSTGSSRAGRNGGRSCGSACFRA